MNQVSFSAAGLFALCASFGGPAMAQNARDASIEPAPSAAQPMTAPDPNPLGTGASDTTPAEPTATALPESTLALGRDPRVDVVERSWPNRPMLVTGLVVLGGTYGASVIVGAVSDREADEKLFLPVVGPWLDLKNRDCEVNDCGNDTFNKVLLIGDGALQGIGALAIVLSLVVPESTKKPWYLIGDEKLSVAPQVGNAVTGLSASGRF
jgi:hypothetical protein